MDHNAATPRLTARPLTPGATSGTHAAPRVTQASQASQAPSAAWQAWLAGLEGEERRSCEELFRALAQVLRLLTWLGRPGEFRQDPSSEWSQGYLAQRVDAIFTGVRAQSSPNIGAESLEELLHEVHPTLHRPL